MRCLLKIEIGICLLLFIIMQISIAETFEVKMLNRGVKGPMVFEPDYLEIQSGDVVKFIATHKSNNAASIPEMAPKNYAGFKGKIDEEIEISFTEPSYYGIQCIPHYEMGMVMIIKVGKDAVMTQEFRDYKAPGIAEKRFKEIIERIDIENKGS